ncbi:hypothetical protein [Elstera sp.]|jgi:hypothetical protein|uniref:hypothetical protein n=1 Tax=Elstera sp. TaxID=1916664 RepID=UPI0037C0A3D6
MGAFPIDFLSAAQGRHPVGERIADWIDPYPAKLLAGWFGVSLKTAESWRAGHFPQMRHLLAMVERWGEGFAAHVLAPVLGEAPLVARLDRLARELTMIQGEVADGLASISHSAGVGPLPAGVAARAAGASPSAARPAVGSAVGQAGGLSARVLLLVVAALLTWGALDTGPDPHALRPAPVRLVKSAPLRGRLETV